MRANLRRVPSTSNCRYSIVRATSMAEEKRFLVAEAASRLRSARADSEAFSSTVARIFRLRTVTRRDSDYDRSLA